MYASNFPVMQKVAAKAVHQDLPAAVTNVEKVAAAAEKVVVGIVAALNNKARDMFALILGLAMVDYAILDVDVSIL